MSRRNRNKEMTEKKFKNKICRRCRYCSDEITPAFCFNKLYKADPKKFINIMPARFHNHKDLLYLMEGYTYKYTMTRITSFRKIFCSTRICKNSCDGAIADVMNCITIFKNQSKPKSDEVKVTIIKKVKNKKKAKVKVISKPEVTIICSDDEEFKKEVKRIIENNNK